MFVAAAKREGETRWSWDPLHKWRELSLTPVAQLLQRLSSSSSPEHSLECTGPMQLLPGKGSLLA